MFFSLYYFLHSGCDMIQEIIKYKINIYEV